MKKRNNLNGFTLIELVIVIVILGLLAVVAAPKFIDISGNATENVLKDIAGDIETALTFTEAKRQIDGSTTTVQYGDTLINLNEGYPEGNLTTLNAILDIKTPSTWTKYWDQNIACDFDGFCMVGNIDNSEGGPEIDGFTSGNAVYIWSEGYILESDNCFSYYVNFEVEGKKPLVGAVTDGC